MARGSTLGLEEVMPCLQELASMFGHEPFQATELVSREPAQRSQGYRFQLELRNGTGLLDVPLCQGSCRPERQERDEDRGAPADA